MKRNANFFIRLITGLLIMPLAIYSIYRGGIIFNAILSVLILIGTIELNTIITHKRITITVVIAVILAGSIMFIIPYGENVLLWFGTVVIGVIVVAISAKWHSQLPLFSQSTILLILSTLYMGHVGAAAIVVRQNQAGFVLWMIIILATASTDTFSYAGGRTYGKTPLAPKISPKKTVEGAITGIIAAIGIPFIYLYDWNLILLVPGIIVVLSPFAAIAGDLLISKLKRMYDAKDSAYKYFNIMPGHGGVMDRIDGLAMVIILTFVVLLFFGLT